MGAHTVGRAHSAASGFDGKWTRDSFAFNNAFYAELIDTSNEWDQIPSPTQSANANSNANGFPQWSNAGGDGGLMMLNADMSLVMAMEHRGSDGRPHIDEATGEVRCRWRDFTLRATEICDAEDSLSIVEEYARDNQGFLEDFAGAWTKVVTLNQRDLHRVDVAAFRDARVDIAVPTPTSSPTVLIRLTEPLNSAEPSALCCAAKRAPNWNGRCWGATSKATCDAVQPPTKRCEWRPSECRATQTCSLRDVDCESNTECCSERCRSDTKQCS